MNWSELFRAVSKAIYNPETNLGIPCDDKGKVSEVKVFFDFPLIPGGQKYFKISAVTRDGIMIRNDVVDRPMGH